MYDIAIIGAGPGGYTSAVKAAQLGAKAILIEKQDAGGTCLNKGCIPSKSIILSSDKFADLTKAEKFGINIQSASYDFAKVYERKNSIVEKIKKSLVSLFNSYEIEYVEDTAIINDANTLTLKNSGRHIEFKNLILATGSKPASIQNIEIDHDFIIDSDDILSLSEAPESVLIVGSGSIGIEWARIFSNFGIKVILTEIAPQIMPQFDISISQRVERLLKKQRVEINKETTIESIEGQTVKLSNGKAHTVSKIFIAAGRTPNISSFGLENQNVDFEGKFIKINENMQTNIPNIYAIGDITGKLQLAHTAAHQGVIAVEHILENKAGNIDYKLIPSVVYGKPEIASIGCTEQELIKAGIDFKVSNLPLTISGKAFVDDELDSFVKILESDGKILGAHIIANEASALLQQVTIAMNSGLKVTDFKNIVFAHPTASEALHEAILNLENKAIHVPKVKK